MNSDGRWPRNGDDSAEAGLLGSEIGANTPRAAAAELIKTFILVFAGTAVAVAADLNRPTAGAAYNSLAIALAFGIALLEAKRASRDVFFAA